MSFRTAWPLKGLIHLHADEQAVHAVCIKRIPWSSAIVTLVWFLLVGLGTTAFMIAYAAQGGFDSLSGVLMGIGILGIGLLVLAFGLGHGHVFLSAGKQPARSGIRGTESRRG